MDSVDERRQAIAAYINEMSSVTFGQIKKAFPDVSDMTIRMTFGHSTRRSGSSACTAEPSPLRR